MADDRTVVTELATGLGMLGHRDPAAALARRPPALAVDGDTWARLAALHATGSFAGEFAAAFANGRAFLHARDALRGRVPVLVEWTGGRRPPGDEVAPIDLRVDHVYLVSCKYLSANIANPSPARIFEGLLATAGSWSREDWYLRTAPEEYAELYRICRAAAGLTGLPDDPAALGPEQRRALRHALPARRFPPEARHAYQRLCTRVSHESAARWRRRLTAPAERERMLWRLLRIGSAPWFLLGSDHRRPLRLRIASPWDWRQRYRLVDLAISPAAAGQPRVDWVARCEDRVERVRRTVRGHVEVRWSHGRFAQPPEAKVYLDTPTDELPGYFPLDHDDASPTLFDPPAGP